MAKLRITVGSLRKIIEGFSSLLEAEDDDDPTKKVAAAATDRRATLLQKAMQRGLVNPAAPSTIKTSEKQVWNQGPKLKKVTKQDAAATERSGVPMEPKDTLGSGKKRHSGEKQDPGYKPLMPREVPRSKTWLQIADPKAWEALLKMGNPRGSLYPSGTYIRFQPADPEAQALFWSGVPKKKKLEKDELGNIELKDVMHGEQKQHAWRTYNELDTDQRRSIGWVPPRDRGVVNKDFAREENDDTPEVRVRGYSGRPIPFAFNDEGWLSPAEANVTADVPGTASADARAAVSHADKALKTKLPSQESLSNKSFGELNQLLKLATDRFKTSLNSHDEMVVSRIKDAIATRVKNIKRRSEEAEKQGERPENPEKSGKKEPRSVEKTKKQSSFLQSPEERWGKRKNWGETSKDVDVSHVKKQKKDDEGNKK